MRNQELEAAMRIMMNVTEDAVDVVKNFVNEHGGVINTCNPKGRNDTIFAYTHEGECCVINCIMVDDDGYVCIHIGEDYEEWKDMSEIEDDRNNWYYLGWDSVMMNSTLYSILEGIEEYV